MVSTERVSVLVVVEIISRVVVVVVNGGVDSVVVMVKGRLEVASGYCRKENGGGDRASVLGKHEMDGEVGERAVKARCVVRSFVSHESEKKFVM